MKIFLLIFFFFLASIRSTQIFAQYVTLEGKQFKDENGADFYPIMMDYQFAIGYDYNNGNPPTNFYFAQNQFYGTNWDFECTDHNSCLANIHNDFQEIHNMGFNTVRFTVGPNWNMSISKFVLRTNLNGHQVPWPNSLYNLEFNQPYITDQNVQLYFSLLNDAVNEAAACSLKVILDVAFFDNGYEDAVYPYFIEYLQALGTYFSSNTTIMDYVLLEEIALYDFNNYHTKQQICSTTGGFYDAIKSVDSHHLISVSGFDIWDITEWDPGVIKMDFYHPHIYPEVLQSEGYDITLAQQRVAGRLYWLNNNSPMPWIIGETGFQATSPYGVNDGMNGDEQDQANYAQFALDRVRDCNASGIGWWVFQDNFYTHNSVIVPDGFGVLEQGLIVAPVPDPSPLEKPVAQNFRSYTTPPPVPASCAQPTNYYDPYNYNSITPGSPFIYTGTVMEEGTTNPIKDAVIIVWTEFFFPNDLLHSHSEVKYTFSQSNGSFIINPYHPGAIIIDPLHPNVNFKVTNITISAISAERESYGIWGGPLPTAPGPINCALKLSPYYYDLQINNEIIDATNSPKYFRGWNTLTVSNTEVQTGATANFIAGSEVTINGEFNAHYGSEAHIYCNESFTDCAAFTGYLRLANPKTTENYQNGNEIKDIEINFTLNKINNSIYIKPNPNNGIFTVTINSNQSEISKTVIRLYDLIGNIVYDSFVNSNNFNLDLATLPKGIYNLNIINSNQSFNQKIIIQ